jgi:hypothetical protein
MSCYWICYWNPAQEGRFERSSSDGHSTEQDWSGWGLLERLIFPHSQGGDTGSNPVGAASRCTWSDGVSFTLAFGKIGTSSVLCPSEPDDGKLFG